jgi:hypothetical protein
MPSIWGFGRRSRERLRGSSDTNILMSLRRAIVIAPGEHLLRERSNRAVDVDDGRRGVRGLVGQVVA